LQVGLHGSEPGLPWTTNPHLLTSQNWALQTILHVWMAIETQVVRDLDITGFCPRFCLKLNSGGEMLTLCVTKLEATAT